MTDTVDKMMNNFRENKGEQMGECKNTFCDENATREWMQHPMSNGFGVCRDCYEILNS